MKIQIKNRHTDAVIFECEATTVKDAVAEALKHKTNLRGSDLSYSNLSGSDLSGSNLRGSDLRGSNLSHSNLSYSDLSYSNLRGSDLSGSNLSYSSLRGSNLSYSNLKGCDFSGSDLSGSNLSYSNLSGCDLSYSNLRGSDLSGSKDSNLAVAMTRICAEGDIIGWKKCRDNVIVKLLIPKKAKRNNAFGRKCRCEYAKVLEIFGADKAYSQQNSTFEYKVGKVIKPDSYDEDFTKECSHGIHFFITRAEAEAY